jgi:hypothetical protein
MYNDDWNIGHRKWSKKDALLGRANIKKKIINIHIYARYFLLGKYIHVNF